MENKNINDGAELLEGFSGERFETTGKTENQNEISQLDKSGNKNNVRNISI